MRPSGLKRAGPKPSSVAVTPSCLPPSQGILRESWCYVSRACFRLVAAGRAGRVDGEEEKASGPSSRCAVRQGAGASSAEAAGPEASAEADLTYNGGCGTG